MTKGSQLSQLKAALSQAGITGPKPSKKRKRATPLEKDKEKKAAKLEEIHQRLNPFDIKVTKLKHGVGGRRLKGITGKPAKSKQAGLEQRKKTLLKEYEKKDRAGGIVDRRFGENDPTMSLEERMLERFTRERQRASKGIAFNLEDEDELTHYGQSLSKLDDFDDMHLRSSSDEDEGEKSGQIGRDIVSRTHFGGFGDEEKDEASEPPRKKSKAEVMAEVVAKSKEHKLRRQMERDKDDTMRQELDSEFTNLRELLFTPDPSASGTNKIPLGPRAVPVTSNPVDDAPLLQSNDYDQHVKELAFDKRSTPKDRTKTEEEIALERKEALEKAEGKRRRRMLGEDEGTSEDESDRKGKRKRGADDLDDDFEEESGGLDGLGSGLTTSIPVEDTESSDGQEDEEAVGSGSDEDAVSGSDDDGPSDNELWDASDEEGVGGEHERIVRTNSRPLSKKNGRRNPSTPHELPYTFPCPESHDEFLEIIEDIDDEDIPTVVQRIRTLFHTSLAAENKFKLQTLAKVLIDHLLYLSSFPMPNLNLISALHPHVVAITRAYPIPVAQHCNLKLSVMHKNLKRGLSKGALDLDSKTWPSLPELSLLRLIALIWPTSDLNHAVVSPARLLLGAYLSLGRVRSMTDIASGLFLSTIFLQFESHSKRLVPEAVNFLVNTVLHLAPHPFLQVSDLPGSFPSPDFGSEMCKNIAMKKKKQTAIVPQRPNLVELLASQSGSEQAKADLLNLSLQLLIRFAEMYKGVTGFIELYEPIHAILERVDGKFLNEVLQFQLVKSVDSLGRLLKFSRQARRPLRLQDHKPIPIPTFIPKFETTSSNYLRRQDPDHEKNEASKLRSQYKQERKGAIRELRKDARFLAAVEQRKQIDKDRAYTERMRRVFGSIEGERAEQKQMEKEKSRDKKRAGRK